MPEPGVDDSCTVPPTRSARSAMPFSPSVRSDRRGTGECMRDDHWRDVGRRVERHGEQGSHRSVQHRVGLRGRNLPAQTGQGRSDLVLTVGVADSLPQDHVFVTAELKEMCQRHDGLRFSRNDPEQRGKPVRWRVELCHARHARHLIGPQDVGDDAHVEITERCGRG